MDDRDTDRYGGQPRMPSEGDSMNPLEIEKPDRGGKKQKKKCEYAAIQDQRYPENGS